MQSNCSSSTDTGNDSVIVLAAVEELFHTETFVSGDNLAIAHIADEMF